MSSGSWPAVKPWPILSAPRFSAPQMEFGRGFLLVAADSNGNDISFAIFCRKLEDFLRRLGTKLSDRVEDPKQRDAEIFFAALAAAFQAFEDGFEIQLPPQAHADRHVNLGVEDVLSFELLH